MYVCTWLRTGTDTSPGRKYFRRPNRDLLCVLFPDPLFHELVSKHGVDIPDPSRAIISYQRIFCLTYDGPLYVCTYKGTVANINKHFSRGS